MLLTTAQLQVLKADIATQVAGGSGTAIEGLDPNNPDHRFAIADWYNGESSFWVWKDEVPASEAVHAIDLSNFGNITEANSARVARAFQIYGSNSNHFIPDAPTRGFFQDMFSAATGAESQALFTALWQRLATRCEALFATGTGTQATSVGANGAPNGGDPGSLVFSGEIDDGVIEASNNV